MRFSETCKIHQFLVVDLGEKYNSEWGGNVSLKLIYTPETIKINNYLLNIP